MKILDYVKSYYTGEEWFAVWDGTRGNEPKWYTKDEMLDIISAGGLEEWIKNQTSKR